MLRRMWVAAAVAAGLGFGGTASAGEEAVQLGRFKPTAGGFAGAVQSAAATDEANRPAGDIELVHGGHRGYYGGYRGYYGGYRGFYGGYHGFYGYPRYGYGFYGFPGYGLGFSYYSPRFAISIGGFPSFYGYGGYGYPRYYSSYYYGYSAPYYASSVVAYPSVSYVYPASYSTTIYPTVGTTVAAPTTSVTTTTSQSQSTTTTYPGTTIVPATTTVTPQTVPAPMPSGTSSYRYDGGPTAPVPLPAPDQPGTTIPPQKIDPVGGSTALPISRPAAKPAYKYPAYGEKK